MNMQCWKVAQHDKVIIMSRKNMRSNIRKYSLENQTKVNDNTRKLNCLKYDRHRKHDIPTWKTEIPRRNDQ